MSSHLDAYEVECPADQCNALPGESCWTPGGHALHEVHEDRVARAELHEVIRTRVPESDVVVLTCTECEWIDSA